MQGYKQVQAARCYTAAPLASDAPLQPRRPPKEHLKPVDKPRLEEQHCTPCRGDGVVVTAKRAHKLLRQLNPAWRISDDGRALVRELAFPTFDRSLGFVNRLAWLAQEQGHHPDFTVAAYHCTVSFTTHALGGLSENDFICAARLDAIIGGES